ncbi:MAG: hypothetical protein Kow0090_12850 [Myxococcota bacterium]
MRHKLGRKKLNRRGEHRTAMLRNMATSLFREERVHVTDARAKELKRFAERLISFGKRGDLHSQRLVARDIRDKEVLTKLFKEIAPRYRERNGGYTRIYKTGKRVGDSAEMAFIELVDARLKSAEEETEAAKGKE